MNVAIVALSGKTRSWAECIEKALVPVYLLRVDKKVKLVALIPVIELCAIWKVRPVFGQWKGKERRETGVV